MLKICIKVNNTLIFFKEVFLHIQLFVLLQTISNKQPFVSVPIIRDSQIHFIFSYLNMYSIHISKSLYILRIEQRSMFYRLRNKNLRVFA